MWSCCCTAPTKDQISVGELDVLENHLPAELPHTKSTNNAEGKHQVTLLGRIPELEHEDQKAGTTSKKIGKGDATPSANNSTAYSDTQEATEPATSPTDYQEDMPATRAPDVRSTLTKSQLDSILALEKELGPVKLEALQEACVPGEAVESLMLRFLKNHSMKARATAKALDVMVAFRATTKPGALALRGQGDVAGCSEELLEKYMPTWHQGFDKAGRPVVFSHYGKFRFGPVLEAGVTVEKILELHVRNSEVTARLCGQQSAKLQTDISNALIIMDTEGWDNDNLKRRAAFDWARGIAKIDMEYYPERMGNLFIINAPPSVNLFYRAISWFLPEKARNQIKIFAGREQWQPALLELVDPSQLPPEYGGTGTASPCTNC